MTDRDSATTSSSALEQGGNAGGATPYVGDEVAASIGEELVHGLAAMVASDVGVQVEPNTLDAVGVGTIGGQEVQDDTVVHCTEGRDRTGIVIARYRVRKDGWTKQQAWDEWHDRGSHHYVGLEKAWSEWVP
jgi:hypothetical protein